MTNREMIKSCNGLSALQKAEEAYYKKTGEQLLKGRIGLTYAIRKNMDHLLGKLKPYEESRKDLIAEYRDVDAEKKYLDEKRAECEKQGKRTGGHAEPAEKEIWRDGKTEEELYEKLSELLDIDVKDVSIHKVSVKILDGLQLSSGDLDVLMFMIE